MALIRPMHIEDHDAVIALLQTTPGVTVRDADSREATARYLARNPGLSFVAYMPEHPNRLIGCIMSGHDGRRGYLQHLVVVPDFRRQGIGNSLVRHCLEALAQLGIVKSHVDVLLNNDPGQAYWPSQGWTLREDIARFSYVMGDRKNA